MRTLIYCTAYAQTPLIWQRRYRRWVDAVRGLGLGQQQIVLVDDGSPVLPGWADTDVVTLRAPEDVAKIHSDAPVLLLRFAERLGRADIYDFPGWYRSFGAGARYATARGFERAIHIESDAYVVSARLREWLGRTNTGWNTLWTAKYNFPEMAIQVIGPDQLPAADAFARRPYSELVGVTHENALPFTQVEKGFVGDRYGEMQAGIPEDADFATQVPAQREPSYYWWLNGGQAPAAELPGRLELGFGRGQDGAGLLGDGWARPEPKGTWMTHAFSVLNLPALPPGGMLEFVAVTASNVRPEGLPVQRLAVQANTQVVAQFDLTGSPLTVGGEIPGDLLRRDGTDRLRLLHPDAAMPASFGIADRRILAVMLFSLTLQPRDPGRG